jgi:hypothetical protein
MMTHFSRSNIYPGLQRTLIVCFLMFGFDFVALSATPTKEINSNIETIILVIAGTP